ncbi:rod shape-determining protein MreB [Aquipseudomonas alcaligenes]|uniref:rod shape-determining protein n=1 Tax=Aquipseudomonas alcaligenes TaxID=43263 RepID=UPI00095590D2|nr:rod shape-determining protein [Pseudomonas alcaligenes]SIR81642.1 rod shape-determining protein MreB [Pseudomonas alcaligenes]
MFRNLTPLLYLKLRSQSISGLHLPSGMAFDEPPVLALQTIKGKREAIAVGHAAAKLQGQPQVEILNGFDHPRTLLADFAVAEKTLQLLVRQIAGKTFLKPEVVLHPLEHLEGGLTQVERRGLYELCHCAGARKIHLWVGRELTLEELRARQFPTDGGTLLTP